MKLCIYIYTVCIYTVREMSLESRSQCYETHSVSLHTYYENVCRSQFSFFIVQMGGK